MSDIPVKDKGEIIFRVIDNQCEWNNNIYRLSEENNKLQITKSDTSTNIQIDIKALSALLYGSFSSEELIHEDWLIGTTNDDNELLDLWFPKKLFFNDVPF